MQEFSKILSGIEVLVVDNDSEEREMLSVALSHFGARVAAVATADEALTRCAMARPHVLVSDISLSDQTDGYGLVRELRSRPANDGGSIPAVAVTGWCRECDRIQAIEAGFQVHLGKPVELDTLAAVVAALARANSTSQEVG